MAGIQVLRLHAHEAIRGMLYMFDSEPYPGTSKDLQFEVIEKHLRSHAYYCSSKSNPSDRRLRDEGMCRELMRNFVSNNRLSKHKKVEEDGFSMLWRIGSKGIPRKVLAKYGYDRETFDVATLPGPRPDILDLTRDTTSADGDDSDSSLSTSVSAFDDFEKISVKAETDGLEVIVNEHEGRTQSKATKHRISRARNGAELVQDAEGFLSEHQTTESELSIQLQPRHTEFSLRDTPARRDQTMRKRLPARKSGGKQSKESSVAAATHRSISSEPRTAQHPKKRIVKLRLPTMSKWAGEMDVLNTSVIDAVDKSFDRINFPTSQCSPYANHTNKTLCSVFNLCFGDNWRSACVYLRDSGSFRANHVLRSLAVTLVRARILSDSFGWQRQLCKEIGLPKTEEVQSIFSKLCDPSQNQEAREKHVPRIYAKVILDTPSALGSFSDKHAEEISGILEPYIDTLAGIAELMNQNHLPMAEEFRAEFKVGLRAAVLCAARLKLHLIEAGQEHSFIWPRFGDEFDADLHEANGHNGEMIAFATLPGLRLIGEESASVLPAHVVCCSRAETANAEM